jgi:hypothetical protein
VLADFFSSVFTVEVDSDLPAVKSRINHKLESIEITPDKVEKKLKDLKISKSPGPDNFHPRVLRELSSVLSAPLLPFLHH